MAESTRKEFAAPAGLTGNGGDGAVSSSPQAGAEAAVAVLAAERSRDVDTRPAARPGRLGRIRQRLRQVGLVLTMGLPQPVKRLVYRWCFGYRISPSARIGLAYLDCASLVLGDNSRISNLTVFLRCGDVVIGRNVHIGSFNLFSGGRLIELQDYSHVRRLCFINAIRDHDCTNNPDSSFSLGYGAVLTAEHRIDFTDRVEIGRCSILGGRNSSIWTHNIRTGVPVRIGSYCYLGSEIRIAPGAEIPDCCVVGLASVLTNPIREPFSLVAGVPARVCRPLTEADFPLIFGKTRPDLPDEVYPAMPPRPSEAGSGETPAG